MGDDADWLNIGDHTSQDIPFNPGSQTLVIREEEPVADGKQRDISLNVEGDIMGDYQEIKLSINWWVKTSIQ